MAAAGLLLAGCGQDDRLMPLRPDRTWTYSVRSGFQQFVEPIDVVREVAVAGTRGFELSGPLGTSRLGWRDGVLWAGQSANARFDPPLPLLANDFEPRTWEGHLEATGVLYPATASLEHEQTRVELGGRRVSAVRATVTLQFDDRAVTLQTWYQEGVGIVRQEQHSGAGAEADLDVSLEILSGPESRREAVRGKE
jgi:hypothetical protein